MLVEDDPMIAEIYSKKFEAAGFEVVNAVTGKEVLKYAGEDNFDLILLDMVLPEMSGMDVLKELRNSGDYSSDLKIIILSNISKSENEKEALENGANDFISKTQYGPSDLVVEVKRLLDLYDEQKKNKARNDGKVSETKDKKKRILFIEDEEIFLEMFGKKLEDEGYELEYAKNGVWGSKLASEKEFDLIITDMVMPAMGGDEIIRRIKLDDKTKDTPILVLSASISEEDIQPVRDLGITDFFEKTRVVPSDLARRVAEILN
ncbi:MAG: Sensor histidine kinase/respose regulator [Candidatus Moranbacteria bacterium GW2011_GWD2_38_7]|nr:MAG: Sensor histidine kinase/respose regulator [Candidatus Moranbacteria bacterium GW2011_GWD2_38_7]